MRGTAEDDYVAQLALMEAYDQEYNIFDHESRGDSDPLAIIGMHPSEDPVTGSKLDLVLREMIGTRLPELTNTSLLDLLAMPRWFLDRLLKEARKNRTEELKVAENLMEQAESLNT